MGVWLLPWLLVTVAQAASLNDTGKQLLTHPFLSLEKQMHALADYLHDSKDQQDAASFVLRSHARLQLAALLLAQKEYRQSRAMLKGLPQNSPVAVPAALLLAQTWLAQGNQANAVQWYLRISQRYPYHPQALAGLLEAAGFLKADAAMTALTLCDRVTHNSLAALADMKKLLPLVQSEGVSALIKTHDGIDRGVQSQLVETMLSDPHAHLFRNDQQVHYFTAKLQALLEQLHQLQQAEAVVAAQQVQLDRSLTQLHQRLAGEALGIRQVKVQLAAADVGANSTLRRQITERMNAYQRDEASLAFLQHSQSALPVMSRRLHTQLDALLRYAQREQLVHSRQFAAEVKESTAKLNGKWHDLAGQGQLLRADLLQAAGG